MPRITITVKGRVAAERGALEACKRGFYAANGHVLRAEALLEHRAIGGIVAQLGNIRGMRLAHLDGIGDGKGSLFFQRARTSVPELEGQVSRVQDGRRITCAQRAAHAIGDVSAVGEVVVRIVARSARKRGIHRDALVVEQLASKRDGVRGRRVVLWDAQRRQPQWHANLDLGTNRTVTDCALATTH